ncbi:MAG: hypothetical protein II984_00590 [Clostridia bacterium]|nr:hypothetical protein [Clostridia bacterium]
MNIFEFINSKDVRKHLEKINYKFSTLEKVFFIAKSEYKTIKEKHEAFLYLIENESDMKIEKRTNTNAYDSLFECLKRYMEIENALLEKLYNNENCAYSYRYLCRNDYGFCEDFDIQFPSYKDCINHYKNDIKEYGHESKIRYYSVKMQSLKDIKDKIIVKFNPGGEALEIYEVSGISEEDSDILCLLDGLWLDIPLPFKRGDIVVRKSNTLSEYSAPMVMRYASTWSVDEFIQNGYTENDGLLKQREKLIKAYKEYGDTTDMCIIGYYASSDCCIYSEVDSPSVNFEYYRDSFENENRILPVISNYEKGIINLEELLKCSNLIMHENEANSRKSYFEYLEENIKPFDYRSPEENEE